MKILIIQSAGRHKQNYDYREGLCLCHAINHCTIQNEAVVWGRGFENYHTKIDQMARWADAIVILENYNAGWVPETDGFKKPVLYWSIDAHVNFKRNVTFAKGHKVNLVLSSTASFVPKFRRNGVKAVWFPNCYPQHLIRGRTALKRYGLGFCGSYVKGRKAWLDKLGKRFDLHRDIFVIGPAMVKAVSSYRIHWNRNYSVDVNYRTFETLGCGTFLLTNNTDRLKDLFDIGKHLVIYDNFDDCCDKIKYYLRHEKEREKIAEAGHAHALRNHTYEQRAKQLIKIIEGI